MIKKILFWTLISFAIIQLIPIDRTNKKVEKKVDFVVVFSTPPSVQVILKNACYDCHSNETVYPNYTRIAPVSWVIKNHINKGREHVNFSLWGTYSLELKQYILENAPESVLRNKMPLPVYISQHPKANLSTKERKILIDYFNEIRKSEKY